jgi:iron complex outermembrane receptor protein
LAFRIGGRLYTKGAMFTATDGGGLGEEQSKTIQGTLYATPNDAFNAKVRIFFGRDDDGQGAGGAIPGRLNDTCTGTTFTTKTGQVVQPIRFPCGIVPKQGKAISALGTTKIIDSNTLGRSQQALISTGDADWLIKNIIQAPLPAQIAGKVPTLEGIELEREIFRTSGAMNYEFDGGIVATLQGGYNTLAANWARDFAFTALDNGYSRDPQYSKDYSAEFRVASAQDQPLRWLAGVSYYKQRLLTSGTGGDAAFLCIDSVPGLVIGACRPPGNAALPAFSRFPNSLGNTDEVKTFGYFGAVTYDITDQININVEGRYQDDELVRGVVTRITGKFKTFLPRVIAQYKPNDDTNIYASFAKGVLPGEVNSAVVDAVNPADQAQFTAAGVLSQLPEELLDSYELGWKQKFFDGRWSTSTAVYYGEWTNKKSRIVVPIRFTCGQHPNAILNSTPGCRPAIGEAGAGQPMRDSLGNPLTINTNVVVSGDSKIYGLEWENNVALTENLTGGWAFNYAGNKFTEFTANFISGYARFTNVKGNAHARYPKFSGSVNAAFEDDLTAEWKWFIRADANYFGKTNVDVDNLAKCDSYILANSRAGVEREGFRMELFVRNMFQDKNWSACSRFSEFDLPNDGATSTLYQSIIVTPQNKRQFGLKTSLAF